MNIKHTSGPWTAVENVVLQRGNKIDREVCVCNGAIDEPTDDANAALVAAAPAYEVAWGLVPQEIRERIFDALYKPDTEWVIDALAGEWRK